ncbi:MAG: GTP-binding protein [Promethearchaeota archaeon]
MEIHKMPMYDYLYKIMIMGDEVVGKQFLEANYCHNVFKEDYEMTIGVEFHVKSVESSGKMIKLQIWLVGGQERFRSLIPMYSCGALGAIFLYDIMNSGSLDCLADHIRLIRQRTRDIPIMLLGSSVNSKDKTREVSWEQGRSLAESYHLSAFAEIPLENEQNVNQAFQTLVNMIFQYCNGEQNPFVYIRKEFIINNYLKLRLENEKTNIYVGGSLFRQCKYLLLNLQLDKIRDYDKIESIDEAAEILDTSMEQQGASKFSISPEVEFWAHCSNIQAWYENNYSSNLLHRNLAFPLLKALVKAGDPLANKVFKEEIALRLESGYPSVVLYLINQGYLNYLNDEELDIVFENSNFLSNLPNWFFKNEIPLWLFEKLRAKIHELNCPYCGIQLKESLTQKDSKKGAIRCEFCHTTLVRIV